MRHDVVDAVVAVEEVDGRDPQTDGVGDRVGSAVGVGERSGEERGSPGRSRRRWWRGAAVRRHRAISAIGTRSSPR